MIKIKLQKVRAKRFFVRCRHFGLDPESRIYLPSLTRLDPRFRGDDNKKGGHDILLKMMIFHKPARACGVIFMPEVVQQADQQPNHNREALC